MKLGFTRSTEMEMTGLETSPGVSAADLATALSSGEAAINFDAGEGVYVITRVSDQAELGWCQEIRETAAGPVDRDFVVFV